MKLKSWDNKNGDRMRETNIEKVVVDLQGNGTRRTVYLMGLRRKTNANTRSLFLGAWIGTQVRYDGSHDLGTLNLWVIGDESIISRKPVALNLVHERLEVVTPTDTLDWTNPPSGN